MRKVGFWIVALCVGYVAVGGFRAVIHQVFGTITGFAALPYVIASILVFAWTTAGVVTWLAGPKRRSDVR